MHQQAVVGDDASFWIEAERVDDAWAAVSEIHDAAVRAPAHSVGDGEAIQHQLDLSTALQPVERAAPWMLIIGERACPEPTLWIAGGIIHPRALRCDLGNEVKCAVRAQIADVPTRSKQPTLIVLDRSDGSNGPRDVMGAHRGEPTVVVDLVAVDPATEYVDVQQLLISVVPSGGLA